MRKFRSTPIVVTLSEPQLNVSWHILFPFMLGYRSAGFLAYLTTDTPGGNAVIVFDKEEYDDNDNYDSTTGVYTVPHNGTYLIQARVYGLDVSATHLIRVSFLYNSQAMSDVCICLEGTHTYFLYHGAQCILELRWSQRVITDIFTESKLLILLNL